MRRWSPPFLIMLSCLAAIVATAPLATAQVCQEPYPGDTEIGFESFTIDLDGGRLVPLEGANAEVEFLYTAPATAWSLSDVSASVEATPGAEWLSVSPANVTRALTPEPGRTEEYNESLGMSLSVIADRDAPHMATAEITFKASAEEGTCVYPAETTHTTEFQVGFYESWSATIEPRDATIGTGPHTFTVIVENEGNDAIELEMDLAEPLQHGFIQHPVSFTVPSGANESVQLEYTGTSRGFEDITLTLNGSPAGDAGIALVSMTIAAVVQVEGGESGEAPGAPLFLLGILLAAMGRATRRRA